MWTVRNGRLFCGRDPVAVRRVVVELVAGRDAGTVPDDKARCMIRLERALSKRDVSGGLARGADGP